MSVATVFFVALLTALATGIGALPLLLGRRIERGEVGVATAVAAGFMVGASVGLFWEGVGSGAARTLVGIVLGAAFIVVTRRQLGHHRHAHARPAWHLGDARGSLERVLEPAAATYGRPRLPAGRVVRAGAPVGLRFAGGAMMWMVGAQLAPGCAAHERDCPRSRGNERRHGRDARDPGRPTWIGIGEPLVPQGGRHSRLYGVGPR